MQLSISNIMFGVLKDFDPQCLCGLTDVIDFEEIRFWDGTLRDHCVFISSASQFISRPPEDGTIESVCFLLQEDVPLPEAYRGQKELHIVVFPAKVSPYDLYNLFSESLPAPLRLDRLMQLIPGKDLSKIAQELERIFRAPVAILSAQWNVLADTQVRFSSTLALLRDLGPFFVPMVRENASSQLVPLRESCGLSGTVFSPVYTRNADQKLLGYLRFEASDLAFFRENSASLEYVCFLLSWCLLAYHSSSPDHLSDHSLYLLQRILDGGFAPSEIEVAVKAAALAPPRNLCIFVMSDNTHDPSLVSLSDLDETFHGIWPFQKIFVRNTYIVMLVGCADDSLLNESRMARFSEKLGTSGLWAGQSDVFQGIDCYFRNHFYRAAAACEAVLSLRPIQRLYPYIKIALYNFANYLEKKLSLPPSLNVLVNPKLLELLELDNRSGTNYVATLCSYYYHNRASNLICEDCHIHRNTLYYRLEKIKEFLGNDFTDMDISMDLHISIAILQISGTLERK